MDPFWVKELSYNEVVFHYKEKWLQASWLYQEKKGLWVCSEL